MARLYKRGSTWYCDLFIAGKRSRRPLSTEKRIAEQKLGELISHRNASRNAHAPSNVTWEYFVNQYIARSRLEKKKPTWQGEERAFRNLERVSPIYRLSQMTPFVLEKCKNQWIKDGRGIYVINRDLRTIRTALHKAESWGYALKQDWTTVKYIRVPKGRLHFFSPSDLRALHDVCHGMFKTLLYLGAFAGMRRSEMAHLEWSDIDFARNRIHITPKHEWTPKDYERRWIPMAPDLAAYLSQLSARKRGRYVLNGDNKPANVEVLSVYFRRLVKKAGVSQGNIHTLRHTYASRYVQSGGNIYKLKSYLGHTSIDTTQIYAHLAPDDADKTIQNMPGIL